MPLKRKIILFYFLLNKALNKLMVSNWETKRTLRAPFLHNPSFFSFATLLRFALKKRMKRMILNEKQ